MAVAFADLPERPLYMEAAANQAAVQYTASDFRELIYAAFPHQGRATPLQLRVTPTNPVSWGITVTTGTYVIGPPGDQYLVTIRTPITVPLTGFITNPPATRTHVVHLVVYDSGNMSSGNTYKASIVVTEDTGGGAGIPTDGYQVPLAWVTVSPGQSFIQANHVRNYNTYTWHGLTARADVFSLASGFIDASAAVPNSSPPRAIYRSGYLTLLGVIRRTSANYFEPGNVYTIGTINDPWRPVYRQAQLVSTSTNDLNLPTQPNEPPRPDLYARLDVTANGEMRILAPYGHRFEYLFLDGARIELS